MIEVWKILHFTIIIARANDSRLVLCACSSRPRLNGTYAQQAVGPREVNKPFSCVFSPISTLLRASEGRFAARTIRGTATGAASPRSGCAGGGDTARNAPTHLQRLRQVTVHSWPGSVVRHAAQRKHRSLCRPLRPSIRYYRPEFLWHRRHVSVTWGWYTPAGLSCLHCGWLRIWGWFFRGGHLCWTWFGLDLKDGTFLYKVQSCLAKLTSLGPFFWCLRFLFILCRAKRAFIF